MASESGRNDFLVDLLALQQDGKQAISAPTNWTTQEPLLEVSTEIDDIVKELGTSILLGGDRNKPARWHFFIGSPGNGKSAAMGKLCRYLLRERGCQIKDEQGCPIQELESTAVPYALDVYEGDNKYVSARIVQDASVVRNPFSPDVDPARGRARRPVGGWTQPTVAPRYARIAAGSCSKCRWTASAGEWRSPRSTSAPTWLSSGRGGACTPGRPWGLATGAGHEIARD